MKSSCLTILTNIILLTAMLSCHQSVAQSTTLQDPPTSIAEDASNFKGKRNGPEGEWIQLFNGKDLDDWTPKFTHHELGRKLQ